MYIQYYNKNNKGEIMAKSKLVVTAEALSGRSDGLCEYFNYINNINHKNHKTKTDAILHVFGSENTMKNIIQNVFDYESKTTGKRGYRKIGSFALSFNLTTPVGSENLSIESWQKIFKDVARDCIKELKLDSEQAKEFSKNIYANLHRQKAGNDHVNFICSKVFSGEVHRKIQQKAFLNNLKASYERAVFKHEPEFYMALHPFETGHGLKQGRVDQWKHDLTQANKAKKLSVHYKGILKAFVEQYGKVEPKLDKLSKKIKNLTIYLDRYFDSLESSDLEKIKKAQDRYNNIVKKIDIDVDELLPQKEDSKVDYEDSLKSLLSDLDKKLDDLSQERGINIPSKPKKPKQ